MDINLRQGDPVVDGLVLERLEKSADGAVALHVRAARSEIACPACQGPVRVSGSRAAAFADVPRDGRPVELRWRRRHFVCTNCGRPSHETNRGLHPRHRVTLRLVDWIRQESAIRPFREVAEACGLSAKQVVSLLGASIAEQSVGALRPSCIGLSLVVLAGALRPVMCDGETGAVVDVFRSTEALDEDLQRWAIEPARSECLLVDPGLHPLRPRIEQAFDPRTVLTSPASAAAHATEMMLVAVHDAVAVQASREKMATKTGLILFSRRADALGRNGCRRLRRWSEEAAPLREAFELKEEFLTLAQIFNQGGWERWRERAFALSRMSAPTLPPVDYRPVITLIDAYADAIVRYRRDPGRWRDYQRVLAAIAALPPGAARSFAATRARVLESYGTHASLRPTT